ncbi:MAG TPA: hypothetical protein DEB09_04090 [Candidatus Magasanikbacteria bacterium]|nr:hypothetical protein [Candidatus Magasanikbacteria bacterium]
MKIKKNHEKFTIVPKLFSLTTNVDILPHFILGPFMYDFYPKGETKLNFSYIVKKDIEKPPELDTKLEYFWGKNGDNRIYYEHPFLGKIKLKMLVERQGDNYHFLVNGPYHKYIKDVMGRIRKPELYLQDAAVLSFSNIGFTILHGACVAKDEKGTLIFGSPKSGKSSISYSLLKKGYNLLCDDSVVLGPINSYATSSRSPYFVKRFTGKEKNNKWSQKYYNLFHTIPIISSLFSLFGSQTTSFFNSFREASNSIGVIDKVKVNRIFILEKGEKEIIKISSVDALRKIIILTRPSSFYFNDAFLQAFFYFNPEIDINLIIRKEEEIILSLVNRSECYLLKANSPSDYINLLDQIINI